eukprot:TRINITY_DN10336_c0_g1_i2.p1 TRINITY_DN10336_c0_g1~~TRINITY_DN10336_c0_g1_i2.p1  ORF type:complete len:715 (+),score=127.44 TRINITY_DN10336_c0_g1_i2:91-2235(+)
MCIRDSYTVQVSHINGSEWTVQRTYAEFEDLKSELEHARVEITDFPRKRVFNSNSASVVEEREFVLNRFLQGTVLPCTRLPAVRDFLQLDSLRASQRVSFSSSEATTDEHLRLRPSKSAPNLVSSRPPCRAQLQLDELRETSQVPLSMSLNDWRMRFAVSLCERMESGDPGSRLQQKADQKEVLPLRTSEWEPESAECRICQQVFSSLGAMGRRHHCRSCGRNVCSACCTERISFHENDDPEPVCETCVDYHLLGGVSDLFTEEPIWPRSLLSAHSRLQPVVESTSEEFAADRLMSIATSSTRPNSVRKDALRCLARFIKHEDLRNFLINNGVAGVLKTVLSQGLEGTAIGALQAVVVISKEERGREEAARVGLPAIVMENLAHSDLTVRRVAALALLSLCQETEAAEVIATPSLLANVEPMLQPHADYVARDMILLLLRKTCLTHPHLIGNIAEIVVGWMVPLLEVFAYKFEDGLMCEDCPASMSSVGRRFRKGTKDLCEHCAVLIKARETHWKSLQSELESDEDSDSDTSNDDTSDESSEETSEETSEDDTTDEDSDDSSEEQSEEEHESEQSNEAQEEVVSGDVQRDSQVLAGLNAIMDEAPVPQGLLSELPRDWVAEFFLRISSDPRARTQLIKHEALVGLARFQADGTDFGLGCALPTIKCLALDPSFKARTLAQCGVEPVALALGKPETHEAMLDSFAWVADILIDQR